jgi:Putative Ig domain
VLRWSPNSKGRQPVAYRIYASDEKGFSISDQPYAVTVGISRTVPAEFPANFVVETTATKREVVGTHVELAGANKAFYRVVAVDAAGKRSGPSDVAASIRPVVFSKPVTSASNGVTYRYPVAATRSLGDLRTRVVAGKETMSFWDVERLRFKIDSGPAWLSIDESTGLLSGTPDRAGRFEVAITALLERQEQRLDESALKWGIEKVIASGTMAVGSASQRFVIEVGP